jgi:hypothetical protein
VEIIASFGMNEDRKTQLRWVGVVYPHKWDFTVAASRDLSHQR